MKYIAAKTFYRDGVLYQPGSALPDLDDVTVAHYQCYGMLQSVEAGAANLEEIKPVGPKSEKLKPSGAGRGAKG